MIDVLNKRISRRTFLKASAAVGATTAASQLFTKVAGAAVYGESFPDPKTGGNVKYIRTGCMGCNAVCGQQVRVVDGIAEKCDGNPYYPNNNDFVAAGTESVPSDISETLRYQGARACAKGQSMIMTLYSPYRITRPLKRTAARGKGKWKAISWEEAINSICHGYQSNSAVAGNEATLPKAYSGSYTIRSQAASFAQIRHGSVPDGSGGVTNDIGIPKSGVNLGGTPLGLGAMPDSEIDDAIGSEGSAAQKAALRAQVGGNACNRLMTLPGGRNQWELHARLFAAGSWWESWPGEFGTTSRVDHRALCNSSYMDANRAVACNYGWKPAFMAGTAGPDFIISFGVDWNEASVPHVPMATGLADARRRGATVVTTDVRVSQTAAKAQDPGNKLGGANPRLIVKPGTDGLVALGIMKHWFASQAGEANAKIAVGYLKSPNAASLGALDARPAGARIVSNSTYLVHTTGANVGKFARGAGNAYMVVRASDNVVIEANDASLSGAASTAKLLPGAQTVGGETAYTTFELLYNYVNTDLTWATITTNTGLTQANIEAVASGCAADAGVNLAVDVYRGACAHTNGLQAVMACLMLNTLQDTWNRTGGVHTNRVSGQGYSTGGVGTGGGHTLAADTIGSDTSKVKGVGIDRNNSAYGKSFMFEPGSEGEGAYGAIVTGFEGANPMGPITQPRQWYPFANRRIQQEAWPSAQARYPYTIRAALTFGSAGIFTISFGSGGTTLLNMEQCIKHHDGDGVYTIPMIVSITTCMDETAAHADYILPETTYLERWAQRNSGYGSTPVKQQVFRRPVVGGYADVTFRNDFVPTANDNARLYISPFATVDTTKFNGVASGLNTEEDFLKGFAGPMSMEDIHIRIGKKLGLKGFGSNGLDTSDDGLGASNYHTAYSGYHARFKHALLGNVGLGGDGAGGTLASPAAPSTFGGDGCGAGAPADGSAYSYLYMGGKFGAGDKVDSNADGWLDSAYSVDPSGGGNKGAGLMPFEITYNHYREAIGKTSGFGAADWANISKIILPKWKPSGTDLDPLSETPIADGGYTLNWHTYKAAWHAQARTTENKWLMPLTGPDTLRAAPGTNWKGTDPARPKGLATVWINPADAPVGVSTGTKVRVTSATNPSGVVGYAQVTTTVNPGSVVCDHHYGRRWFGSGKPSHAYTQASVGAVAGRTNASLAGPVNPDSRIAAGAAHSPAVRATRRNGADYNIGLTEPISGMQAFQAGKVKVEKA